MGRRTVDGGGARPSVLEEKLLGVQYGPADVFETGAAVLGRLQMVACGSPFGLGGGPAQGGEVERGDDLLIGPSRIEKARESPSRSML